MNFQFQHEQEQTTQRAGQERVEEVQLEDQMEQELGQLLSPLVRREVSPELNTRLRRTLRETSAFLAREQRKGALLRLVTRRVAVPVPLAAAAIAIIAGLGSWVTVLEFGGGSSLPVSAVHFQQVTPQLSQTDGSPGRSDMIERTGGVTTLLTSFAAQSATTISTVTSNVLGVVR